MFDASAAPASPPVRHDTAHDVTSPRRHDITHDITVPRGHDSHMTCHGGGLSGAVELALENIEERLEELNRQIVAISPLVAERERLMQARTVLLGGPGPGGSTPPPPRPVERVTREQIFDFLTRNPGSSAGETARALGCGQGAVSAHLYRGKDRRFSRKGGRWFPVPAGPT